MAKSTIVAVSVAVVACGAAAYYYQDKIFKKEKKSDE
jgi:hypothetical protein